MDDLMNRLRLILTDDNVTKDFVTQSFSMNPYRQLMHEVLLERKEILRSKLNVVQFFDAEEPSTEIEEILEQFVNPTFPLEEVNTEKDEEWQPLERKYLDGVNRIKEEMLTKQMQLEKDMERATNCQEDILRAQQQVRPIDERDFCNARLCITKKFDLAKLNLRGEAATKILVLRRDIEQQGRKRRNFDKNTTDILQNWFHEHRQNPYPSDQEKADLAKQCNIKISQVNNWFGNQRIRSKQQALRMLEEEERERLAQAHANDAQLIPSNNSMSTIVMGNPSMQAMVISANSHQPNLLTNQQGFIQQAHYFPNNGQMQHTDNGNGQQFYNDFDNFGLISSDTDHFNGMPY